jgi:hypothetical protein
MVKIKCANLLRYWWFSCRDMGGQMCKRQQEVMAFPNSDSVRIDVGYDTE